MVFSSFVLLMGKSGLFFCSAAWLTGKKLAACDKLKTKGYATFTFPDDPVLLFSAWLSQCDRGISAEASHKPGKISTGSDGTGTVRKVATP